MAEEAVVKEPSPFETGAATVVSEAVQSPLGRIVGLVVVLLVLGVMTVVLPPPVVTTVVLVALLVPADAAGVSA
ncbi:hypothetical protein [Roseateles aquae]|uniref:hypothetical protein n=1 Tax=Roseateles aquae TaxID=3077235 RepID=UPI0028E2DCBA|nr:hypothetical protein [Paucibacter sp. APW11]